MSMDKSDDIGNQIKKIAVTNKNSFSYPYNSIEPISDDLNKFIEKFLGE